MCPRSVGPPRQCGCAGGPLQDCVDALQRGAGVRPVQELRGRAVSARVCSFFIFYAAWAVCVWLLPLAWLVIKRVVIMPRGVV